MQNDWWCANQRALQRCRDPTKPTWSCWLGRTCCVRWMIVDNEEIVVSICLNLFHLWTGKSPSRSISPGLVSLSQSGPQPPFGWWPNPFVLTTRIACKSKHGRKVLMFGNISILPSWLAYWGDLYFQDSYRGMCQGVHFLLWKLFLTGQKTWENLSLIVLLMLPCTLMLNIDFISSLWYWEKRFTRTFKGQFFCVMEMVVFSFLHTPHHTTQLRSTGHHMGAQQVMGAVSDA